MKHSRTIGMTAFASIALISVSFCSLSFADDSATGTTASIGTGTLSASGTHASVKTTAFNLYTYLPGANATQTILKSFSSAKGKLLKSESGSQLTTDLSILVSNYQTQLLPYIDPSETTDFETAFQTYGNTIPVSPLTVMLPKEVIDALDAKLSDFHSDVDRLVWLDRVQGKVTELLPGITNATTRALLQALHNVIAQRINKISGNAGNSDAVINSIFR